MAAAIECAGKGRGTVEPNPMVGAVIVRDGVEIARGHHGRFGGPHAEIEALRAATQAGADVHGATMYVSLEPCCHRNKKTPPCTDAIIAAGIARVVVATKDPDANVAGRGLQALRDAGIAVECGLMESRANHLLRAYIKLRTRHRPWVICKWAQTADGCLALPAGQGQWISSDASRRRVHELRAGCDGICVGIRTVLADDPLLTNRSGTGRQPTRLVLDSDLRTPPDSRLVGTAGQWPVIVACACDAIERRPAAAEALEANGVEVLGCPGGQRGVDLPAVLDELGGRAWTYLLVEGGPRLLDSFISAGLADELWVFVAPRRVGGAAELPRFDVAELQHRSCLGQAEKERLGADTLLRYILTT